MGRYDNGTGPVFHTQPSVFRREDSLDHHRKGGQRAQPVQVIPGLGRVYGVPEVHSLPVPVSVSVDQVSMTVGVHTGVRIPQYLLLVHFQARRIHSYTEGGATGILGAPDVFSHVFPVLE